MKKSKPTRKATDFDYVSEVIHDAMSKFIGQKWTQETHDKIQKNVAEIIDGLKKMPGFEHINVKCDLDGKDGKVNGTIYISGLEAVKLNFPEFPKFPDFPEFPDVNRYDAVKRMQDEQEKKAEKDLLDYVHRNCAIGCRYFGENVIHMVCEPETTKDITGRQIKTEGPPMCKVPPEGWWCSREAGHEGPCAARRSQTNPVIPRPKQTASPIEEIAKASMKTPPTFYEEIAKSWVKKPPATAMPRKLFHECEPHKRTGHSHEPRLCKCCDTWYCMACLVVVERPSLWTRIKMWLFP